MVPASNKKEWRELLTAKESPPLKSLSFKLKLASLKANIKIENMTLEEAVMQLHDYCISNQKMYAKDLESIFGQ